MQNDPKTNEKQQARDKNAAATRPQRAGEGGTTRFGMEDGDNTDVPSTGLDPDAQSKPPA